MDNQINVLDYGYVKFIEHMGSDERIIEAARMSTDGAFRGWGPIDIGPCDSKICGINCERCHGTGRLVKPGDEKLLRYLYENKHNTPFEMANMVIEVQAPIFVFREWHRHRTQSYNELSARYTPLPDLYYHPNVNRCMLNSKINKQAGRAKGAAELTPEIAKIWLQNAFDAYDSCEKVYKEGMQAGIPKEVARIVMPVGHYSRMRANANLRNWLAFLTLRMDDKAQWEIRQFADAVGKFIEFNFPKTWALFVEGKKI